MKYIILAIALTMITAQAQAWTLTDYSPKETGENEFYIIDNGGGIGKHKES
jgi:hypothetical protein